MNGRTIILPPPACIYCGDVVKGVKKGEHIVPAAIGGVRTIKDVCSPCNNGILSQLDNELCTASPLALVAARKIQKGVGLTWDVDHSESNMLMEACPQWNAESMMLWPQLIVTREGMQVRCDFAEVRDFGPDRFYRAFLRQVRRTYIRWNLGGKGLHFERLHAPSPMLERYSYPPRIFSRVRIDQLSRQRNFVVGYATESDRRRLLHVLHNLGLDTRLDTFSSARGSSLPVIRRYWRPDRILRALVKLGINLLRECCERTTVDSHHFREATDFVLGKRAFPADLPRRCGFVRPDDFADLHRSDDGHSFRLTHSGNQWYLQCSFFGGCVCALVDFPGPSDESWCVLDVSTPLATGDRDITRDWTTTPRYIYTRQRYCVEWTDPSLIVPSIGLINNTCFTDMG